MLKSVKRITQRICFCALESRGNEKYFCMVERLKEGEKGDMTKTKEGRGRGRGDVHRKILKCCLMTESFHIAVGLGLYDIGFSSKLIQVAGVQLYYLFKRKAQKSVFKTNISLLCKTFGNILYPASVLFLKK